MRHAVPLFLEDDTIHHLDWLVRMMSQKKNATVSRSDAVAYLVRQNWKKTMARQARKRPVAVPGV